VNSTDFDIEIVLRESDRAVTERASHPVSAAAWGDADVRDVLKMILEAIDRAKHPHGPERPASLRGFSWIVEPFDPSTGSAQGRPSGGQVVIAIEIPMGAAVAGPFDIAQDRLTAMIGRAIAQSATSDRVH
jgi:hypothetical protein